MKTIKTIFAVALLFVMTSTLYSQTVPDLFSIGVTGGGITPIGTFTGEAQAGPRINISTRYNINELWAIGTDLAYNSLRKDQFHITYFDGTLATQYNLKFLTTHYNSALQRSNVFIEGGLGLYNFRVTRDTLSNVIDINHQTELQGGVNLGLGGNLFLDDQINFVFKTKIHQTFIRQRKAFITFEGGLAFKL